MSTIAFIGAPLEAFGHPSICSEPASGTVTGTSTVSVNGKDIASQNNSRLNFGSHGHNTSTDPKTGSKTCIDYQSHSIRQNNVSETVSINGSPICNAVSGVANDPGSGGSVNYVSSNESSTVTITE
jgi:uncharacterized Zn-binding protein involved in type VI secretion